MNLGDIKVTTMTPKLFLMLIIEKTASYRRW